jgi:UDP-N-acetylglucosamine 1-carboxyvinyltransferase
MGASTDSNGGTVLTAPTGLRATDVFMDEPSVMATENALMAAALTPGTTIIGNAACEPHVQDLARMLTKMGADIRGNGSNVLVVTGKRELGGCEHDIAPTIEIGSFMALASHRRELRIKDTVPGDLRTSAVFERVGLTRNSTATTSSSRRPAARRQADVGDYKSKIRTALARVPS